jgi:type IV fimbrial biogenesis protein FimT
MKLLQKGITLLEVLIAIAILGIISAITLPNLTPMLESGRANNYIDEFNRIIKFARAKATSNDAFVVVCPIADPDSGGACTSDWQKNPIVAFALDETSSASSTFNFDKSKDTLLRVMQLPNKNDKVLLQSQNSAITIDSQGRVNGQHQLIICINGKTDISSTAQLSASGNVWKSGSATSCSAA